jgi:hypothetical protein
VDCFGVLEVWQNVGSTKPPYLATNPFGSCTPAPARHASQWVLRGISTSPLGLLLQALRRVTDLPTHILASLTIPPPTFRREIPTPVNRISRCLEHCQAPKLRHLYRFFVVFPILQPARKRPRFSVPSSHIIQCIFGIIAEVYHPLPIDTLFFEKQPTPACSFEPKIYFRDNQGCLHETPFIYGLPTPNSPLNYALWCRPYALPQDPGILQCPEYLLGTPSEFTK